MLRISILSLLLCVPLWARTKIVDINLPLGVNVLSIQNNVGDIFIQNYKPSETSSGQIKIKKIRFDEGKCKIENRWLESQSKYELHIFSTQRIAAPKCEVRVDAQILENKTIEVQNGIGKLQLNNLKASIKYDIGTGTVTMNNVQDGSVVGVLGTGSVDMKSASLSQLDLKIGTGDVIIQGKAKKFFLNLGSGRVDMKMNMQTEDFEYDLQMGVGSVNVALPKNMSFTGQLLTGRGKAKSVFPETNKATSRLSIRTGVGDILIKKI